MRKILTGVAKAFTPTYQRPSPSSSPTPSPQPPVVPVETPAEQSSPAAEKHERRVLYKRQVEPVARLGTEEIFLGKLFTVQRMPEKASKGKRYAVFEVRSDSPHLLPCAAKCLHAAGAFPGLFTRGEDGKPKNLYFSDALKNIKNMEQLWLMVFIPLGEEEGFPWLNVLRSAAAQHLEEVAPSKTRSLVTFEHVGNHPDCVFQAEDGGEATGVGVQYEVVSIFTDALLQVNALLAKNGYPYGVVLTSDSKGTPRQPVLLVTIPAVDERAVQDFPEVVKQCAANAMTSYRTKISNELKALDDENIKQEVSSK